MTKIPILATGLSGLVGTRISEILSSEYEFRDVSLTTGIDITDFEAVDKAVRESDSEVILHMAAKTDVDACEDDKILGDDGGAWRINVVGTDNIIACARKYGKRVIYVSTDFVFDGTSDEYHEDDLPNPVSWYGYTKHLGEEHLAESNVDFSVIRISYPYRNLFEPKKDFVHRIIDQFKKEGKIHALTDHIFTPTLVDDIATGLKVFLGRNLPGIYHLTGGSSLTTIDAVRTIAATYNIKCEIIPIDRATYFKDRAFRPFKLALKNDKISKLGITMSDFAQGLKTVKQQDS
ncbi:MAG: dTDP-4-dehydrorhamnose reductase, dTDP-4-dehydrorhamnose reductase [Candidatus Gottesmanbacteria bacterium GW2011_GWA2_43_14]|uniref:dTDP-4-dehydrorhamnose reductase n=1 Tax=Candidatus Gottesmanbacteria bacterium GW2011_GWA2_43_14 TaxID=1618443 RepID=A0A0G1GIT8_9BACT|nr:MAG: dTDP-4-dehydrorhamnose reductase, dTDP-4-dehydrorhamnose reductase [Candidatus Gottesmanbacteria bacterium GW2011_GWA2_43_14]